MDKFFGVVGFAECRETDPGVYIDGYTERNYYGDIIKQKMKFRQADSVNDNVNLANDISIIADPYAYEHFRSVRYVILYKTKWKVEDVQVQYPRLILTIGGVYNGDEREAHRIT